jgi:UDP-glucose 4-epimerase
MILVTGCAGYIGSHICYILKKKRINFIGIDNLKYSNKENIISKKKFLQI